MSGAEVINFDVVQANSMERRDKKLRSEIQEKIDHIFRFARGANTAGMKQSLIDYVFESVKTGQGLTNDDEMEMIIGEYMESAYPSLTEGKQEYIQQVDSIRERVRGVVDSFFKTSKT